MMSADSRARAVSLAEASSQSVLAAHVEPSHDIAHERAKATFDVSELSCALAGGKAQLERRRVDYWRRLPLISAVESTESVPGPCLLIPATVASWGLELLAWLHRWLEKMIMHGSYMPLGVK